MNKNKQKLVRRLRLIEGQVRGLQKMIEEEKYCIDVITQTSAVKSALSVVEDELMGAHLSTCVIQQMRDGEERKSISEILKVYSLKRK